MRNRNKVLIALFTLLLPFFTFSSQKAAATEQTYLNVVNPLTGDQWFNFTAPEKSIGDTFIINITIADVVDLGTWQFGLQWNSSLLTFVSATIPSDHVFKDKNPITAHMSVPGLVIYGSSIGAGQTGFSGSGRLAQVELRIVNGGGHSPLSFEEIGIDTFLLDSDLMEISFTPVNGYYEYSFFDLRIQNVLRTPSLPNYDESVQIEASVSHTFELESVFVLYSYGNSTIYVNMTNIGADNFTASIPPLPFNTNVSYRIYTMDIIEHWASSDDYSYTVADFVAPDIVFVDWKPSCPPPYVLSNITRAYEPVLITANISEPIGASGVAIVLFYYRANFEEWWNTTMTYNATSGLWMRTIPGHQGNSTIELFIKAFDNTGNWSASSVKSFIVKPLPIGDVNGDSVTNMRDIQICILHFNEKTLNLAILNFNKHE